MATHLFFWFYISCSFKIWYKWNHPIWTIIWRLTTSSRCSRTAKQQTPCQKKWCIQPQPHIHWRFCTHHPHTKITVSLILYEKVRWTKSHHPNQNHPPKSPSSLSNSASSFAAWSFATDMDLSAATQGEHPMRTNPWQPRLPHINISPKSMKGASGVDDFLNGPFDAFFDCLACAPLFQNWYERQKIMNFLTRDHKSPGPPIIESIGSLKNKKQSLLRKSSFSKTTYKITLGSSENQLQNSHLVPGHLLRILAGVQIVMDTC